MTLPEQPSATGGSALASGRDANAPVSTLRGAGVQVDARRVAQVFIGLGLTTLAVLGIAFLTVGIRKNSQIEALRNQGVPVTITITQCVGLMGGSGSNIAGYACRGSYKIGGQQFNEAIPGDLAHALGSKVKGVAVPSDPGLVSTASAVASEQASIRVFIAPLCFFGLFVILGVLVLVHRRSSAKKSPKPT